MKKLMTFLAVLSRKAGASMKSDSATNITTIDYQKVNQRGEQPLFHGRYMVTNQQKNKFWSSMGQPIFAFGCLLVVALLIAACGSSSNTPSNSSTNMANVNVSLSDPATCAA